MSRMFPWKATFLRHHYQLATGECTFKRAVIRRRRRGLPVRGFQGSAVASETSSESRLALSVFNCIVSSEQSLSFSESAKSFGGEKTFCFGNIWRFPLFPFYLPFDSKMCFPDTITRSEVKNEKYWLRGKKIPAHNRNWKIFQRVWYYFSLQWFHWGWMICRFRQGRGPFKVQPDANHLKTLIAT